MREFKAESRRLLDLMIGSIYTNHEVFLRELISNASDALDKARLAAVQADEEPGELTIHVSFDRAARLLTVSDTGIGMDEEALARCLGTIAHSDSRQLKELVARQGASCGAGGTEDVDIIGQFGVGFYSAFMVADHVSVVSRARGGERAYRWDSDGVEGYEIAPAQRQARGTDVIVHLRPSTADENLERYLDQSSLQLLIRRYSNYVRYPITMDLAQESFDEHTGELVRDESVVRRTVVNAMTPIWTLDEEAVSDEELTAFYRSEFHDPDAPLRVIRARARGAIEYDALLFVPGTEPAELYTKDFRYGPRLYSSGVLIDDACPELLPSHLRFVQGIVDTTSLSLNVSREAIQQDARIQIIARQLERSVLDSLKAMVSEDRAGYERLFEAHGTGLRYAICASRGELTNVLNDLLLYHSARNRRLVTLQEYLDEAGDTSKHAEILYAVGTDVERLRRSPAVTATLEAGRDVLLCPHGAQDEFCLMVMGTYKGAGFRSVTSASYDPSAGARGDAGNPASPQDDARRTLDALRDRAPLPLIRVDVARSLVRPDQAGARIATDGLMTMSLAKYVTAKLGATQTPQPLWVLEVNVVHPLFAIAQAAQAADDEECLAQCAQVLVGQALLAEDVALPDPAAFNRAVNALIARGASA